MPICTLSNIEKSFGQRVIFDHLEFMIDRGERVGMIGDNGAGKTTLFKVITGEVVPESGVVAMNKSVKVGYLKQDATFDENNTVMDEAELAFAELHDLAHRMRELEHDMAEHGEDADRLDKILKDYEKAQHDFEAGGGYAWHHKLEDALLGVGMPEASWEQKVGTLSGGQRSRLALAKILIAEPDMLLLDEPTNHLDLAAIDWLENYLSNFSGAVLLISHDRYLLDRLATRIVWLTRSKIQSYPGNYSSFVTQREMQELAQARAHELQQADIDKQKEFIRRFGAGQRSKEAKGREKRLDRLLKSDQILDAVTVTSKINLQLDTSQRAGDQVLQVRELGKSFDGKKLWADVKFDVVRGERIGIIGPNGSGKTTMLRVLLGQEPHDTGKVKWGANLNIAYYDQRLDEFDPELTVLEQVAEDRPTIPEKVVRDTLGALLFTGDQSLKLMGLLSGGERARVALAMMLLDGPNVLILDEPTNHLDVRSCEALENALKNFPGTIFCVSHDRYFLQQTVGRLLVIDPPDVSDFDGGFDAWMEKQHQKQNDAKRREQDVADAAKKKEKQEKHARDARSEPRREQKPAKNNSQKPSGGNAYARPFGRLSMKQLEEDITETEMQVARCQLRFNDSDVNRQPNKMKIVRAECEGYEKKLKQLEEEYYLRGQ